MSDFFIPSVSGTTVTHGPTVTKSESLLLNLTDIILIGSFVAIFVGVMIGLWFLLKKKMTSSRPYGPLQDLSQRDLESQGALPNQLLRDNQTAGAKPVSYTHLTLPTNREV